MEQSSDAIVEGPTEADDDERDYPESAAEIPLSQLGSLFLIVSIVTSSVLSDSISHEISLDLFPHHWRIVDAFLGTDAVGGQSGIGQEPVAVVDAIIALGLWAFHAQRLGRMVEMEGSKFHSYLRV